MLRGKHVQAGQPQEVQDKYGHLLSLLPAVAESKDGSPTSSEGHVSRDDSQRPEDSMGEANEDREE